MDFLRNFFSHEYYDIKFKVFGPLHIFILVALVLFCIHCFNKGKNKRFEILLLSLIAINQSIMYIWYSFEPFPFEEGLPLYTCRIAAIAIVLGSVFKSKYMKYTGVYLGLIGGMVAMLYPGLAKVNPIHFNSFNYFISHSLLIGVSVYFIGAGEGKDILSYRRKVHLVILPILMIVGVVNYYLATNYSYLAFSPVFSDFSLTIPFRVYFIFAMLFYQLIIFITANFIRILNAYYLKKHNYEMESVSDNEEKPYNIKHL